MAFRMLSSGIRVSGRDGYHTLKASNVTRLPCWISTFTDSDPESSEPLNNTAEQSKVVWMTRKSSEVQSRSVVM